MEGIDKRESRSEQTKESKRRKNKHSKRNLTIYLNASV